MFQVDTLRITIKHLDFSDLLSLSSASKRLLEQFNEIYPNWRTQLQSVISYGSLKLILIEGYIELLRIMSTYEPMIITIESNEFFIKDVKTVEYLLRNFPEFNYVRHLSYSVDVTKAIIQHKHSTLFDHDYLDFDYFIESVDDINIFKIIYDSIENRNKIGDVLDEMIHNIIKHKNIEMFKYVLSKSRMLNVCYIKKLIKRNNLTWLKEIHEFDRALFNDIEPHDLLCDDINVTKFLIEVCNVKCDILTILEMAKHSMNTAVDWMTKIDVDYEFYNTIFYHDPKLFKHMIVRNKICCDECLKKINNIVSGKYQELKYIMYIAEHCLFKLVSYHT